MLATRLILLIVVFPVIGTMAGVVIQLAIFGFFGSKVRVFEDLEILVRMALFNGILAGVILGIMYPIMFSLKVLPTITLFTPWITALLCLIELERRAKMIDWSMVRAVLARVRIGIRTR